MGFSKTDSSTLVNKFALPLNNIYSVAVVLSTLILIMEVNVSNHNIPWSSSIIEFILLLERIPINEESGSYILKQSSGLL